MEKEPACPSLNRLAALMQRVYRVRELIVADPLARVALVSVQTDLLRVHKLIKRHRATCAHCKLNPPLRENPSHKTLPSPKVVPINRAKLSHAAALPTLDQGFGGAVVRDGKRVPLCRGSTAMENLVGQIQK